MRDAASAGSRSIFRANLTGFLRGSLSLLALLSFGCGGSDRPTEPSDPKPDPDPDPVELTVEVAGRFERSSVVSLSASSQAALPGPVTWSVEPADGAELIDGGTRARLLRAGQVVFRAQSGELSAEARVEVAVPPTIVFDMQVDGNRDIYRAALDGGDLVRLTTEPHEDRSPTVANGTIVFVSYRSGGSQLHSVPLEGGAVTQLTYSGGTKYSPALSPDGTKLVFANDASGVPKIWSASADGTGAARAAPGFGYSGAIDTDPAWSPNGDRVVFVSTTLGTADIFILNPSTGQVDTLVRDPTPDIQPAWSPDGDRVAFASERGGQTDLYLIDLIGGQEVRLTDRAESDAGPAWLADGRIVYRAWVDGVPRLRWLDPANPSEIHEIPIDDGPVGRVTAVW